MKSLHKKIGVIALSSALVMGGAFAGASHMRSLSSKGLVAEAAVKKHKLELPFLLESELYDASQRKRDENDRNMVYGLSGIFDYQIRSLYAPPKDKLESHMLYLGDFKSGNAFLRALVNRNLRDDKVYVARVGSQGYQIQFNKYSNRNKMWWLYLDKWQYGADVFFQNM